jgi:hypothetical protein
LEAAEQKREKLQAEAEWVGSFILLHVFTSFVTQGWWDLLHYSMLIEQMHELAPDVSLAPDFVDLSSDDEGSPPYDNGGSYGHSYGHLHPSRHDGSPGQSHTIDNSMLPSSSINYFSSSLFGPNSGFDINMHSPPPLPSAPLASTSSSYAHNTANGRASMAYGISSNSNGKHLNNGRAPPPLPKQERLIMLTPEQAHEEELRIEAEQKARQKPNSYNPDNVKVRIVSRQTYRFIVLMFGKELRWYSLLLLSQGVMPSTFVHPLVHGGGTSNRSSKSRSPCSVSDNALEGTAMNEDSGITVSDVGYALGQRPAKRARTISKEKSPIKESDTIKEEEEPNPPWTMPQWL